MKNLLSLAAAIMFVGSSFTAFAQTTGNQPSGNLVYGPDGNIYGAYTRTLADWSRPSTIYRYTPGASTIDPIFRLDDHVLQVHAVDSNGYIYGTAVNYHPNALYLQNQSRIFRMKNDGTEFRILRTGGYIPEWGAYSSLVIVNEFLYAIMEGGYGWQPGKVIRINKNDGSDYVIIQNFPTVNERASMLMPRYEIIEESLWSYRVGGIVGFWTATSYGGTYGKGSVVGRDFYGMPVRDSLNFVGYQGGFYDGEGPVTLMHGYATEVLAITQRGGQYNAGAIFSIHDFSDIPIFSFPAEYAQPFGIPFSNDSTLMIFGLGGNFDNNTGFIYSLNQSTMDFFFG
jgi:hypothetical protein